MWTSRNESGYGRTCGPRGPIPKYSVAHSTKWITFEWVMTTPLGVPVEPEVKRM
jgi:hypothetical protein